MHPNCLRQRRTFLGSGAESSSIRDACSATACAWIFRALPDTESNRNCAASWHNADTPARHSKSVLQCVRPTLSKHVPATLLRCRTASRRGVTMRASELIEHTITPSSAGRGRVRGAQTCVGTAAGKLHASSGHC